MTGPIRPDGDVSLRPAKPSDQRLIKTLVRAEGLNPMSLDWHHFWLAQTADGQVIGCGQVKPHSDGSTELASLVVLPAWRQCGVAGMLIGRLKELAGTPLWLTCRSSLVGFYEKFAFVEVTQAAALPPYFRRLRRAARLFLALARAQEHLAIMVWDTGRDDLRPATRDYGGGAKS